MSVLAELTMFPTDRGESVSAYVSRIIAMIDDRGLDYRLTPMGTITRKMRLLSMSPSQESSFRNRINCLPTIDPTRKEE
jgi:hypothetical protein